MNECIHFVFDSEEYFFISHTTIPTDPLQPSPAYFRIFQVFLIYFSKCPNLSILGSEACLRLVIMPRSK